MKRAMGLLGLCTRAGKVQSGEQAVELAIRRKQAELVLLDGAVSAGTRKAFQNACAYHTIPIRLTDAEALGEAIGKPGRRVAVITDGKLAQKLAEMLPEPAECGDPALIHND